MALKRNDTEPDTEEYDEESGEYVDTETGEITAAPARGAVTPDPALVAAAREQLRAARRAAGAARRDRSAAEDALADAEGLVAVAEYKVADYEADETLQPWQQAAAREELAAAKRAHARAARRVAAAEDDDEIAARNLEAAEEALRQAEETPAPPPPPPPVPRFASLEVFVAEYVVPNWVHKLGDNAAGRWCSKWWEHAEAITRLEATWEAFEVMRTQPAPSLSTWLRDHFDTHMAKLTAPDGCFHRCSVDKHIHENKHPWAIEPAPEGMFHVNTDAPVQPKPSAINNADEVTTDTASSADGAGKEKVR